MPSNVGAIGSAYLFFCTILCLGGCAAGSGESSGNESGSIFGRATYPIRAVLVDRDQRPVPLESLSVYASPASTVRRHLAPTIEEYHRDLEDLQARQSETQVALNEQEKQLVAAQSSVSAEYEERRPKEQDLSRARNPLKELSKIRAEKSKVDEWFKNAMAERVEPIENKIAALRDRERMLQSDMLRLRADFNDRIFRALEDLPKANRKQWKTKGNGETTVSIPNNEPWTVWSVCLHEKAVAVRRDRQITSSFQPGGTVRSRSTEIERAVTNTRQLRWMLTVPDDLVGGELHLDQETAFDQQAISVKFDDSRSPYLSRRAG